MKPFLLLAALVTLTTCNPLDAPPPDRPDTASRTTPSADIAAVQILVQEVFDSIWSGTDTAQVRRLHTADFIILEHGEVWTNDTIRDYQLRVAAGNNQDRPVRKNSFDFIRTEHLGDRVWAAYHNRADFVRGADTIGTMGWLESIVAVRTDEGWKLEMMHSTRKSR